MKKNLVHRPLFRIVVPFFYGLMMYFLILLITNTLDQIADTMFTQELLICVALSYVLTESVRFSTVLLERSLKDRLKKPFNVLLIFLLNLLVGSSFVFLFTFGYFKIYVGYESIASFRTELLTLLVPYGTSAFLYTLFYLSLFLLNQKNETELKRESLKRQNLEHQLEIFNNEINPDLLFQSLETLISLVHHERGIAEDFVDRLSLVYRYILDSRKRELVSLKEEIKACENLFYLFKEKFPDQLNLKINHLEKFEARLIVPNAMTMLLDCIINGSIISKWQPLTIAVDWDEQEDYLVIQFKENDKLSINGSIKKRHNNLHEAYAYFTERPVIEIKAYGDAFIKLPLLDIQVS